jgi:hypothetical protein
VPTRAQRAIVWVPAVAQAGRHHDGIIVPFCTVIGVNDVLTFLRRHRQAWDSFSHGCR